MKTLESLKKAKKTSVVIASSPSEKRGNSTGVFYFKVVTMEEWRDVVGYEGLYQVSNLGRVKSLDRVVDRKRRNYTSHIMVIKGKILSPASLHSGYDIVVLTKNNNSKTKTVHRLVAAAFLPPVEIKRDVDHIDRNKLNNNAINLRWSTKSANRRNCENIQRSTSMYNGVSWFSGRNCWTVTIRRTAKTGKIFVGNFSSEIYAAFSFDRECKKRGLNRELNFL